MNTGRVVGFEITLPAQPESVVQCVEAPCNADRVRIVLSHGHGPCIFTIDIEHQTGFAESITDGAPVPGDAFSERLTLAIRTRDPVRFGDKVRVAAWNLGSYTTYVRGAVQFEQSEHAL